MSKRKKYIVSIDWIEGTPAKEIIVPICLRSPAVHGRRFEKTLEEIADVPNIHIVICDRLDRHNLTGTSNNPEKESIKMADEWLILNLPKIKAIIPQHHCVRWKDIQDHKNFPCRLKAVTDAYNFGGEIKTLLDGMASYYINRKSERLGKLGHKLDLVQEHARSVNYLIEEMAGDMTYHEMFPNAPRVYWGLSVDDLGIFNRNLPEIGCSRDFPPTAPITITKIQTTFLTRREPSVTASTLYAPPHFDLLSSFFCREHK